MKHIRKDLAEANEIARYMGKDVRFSDIYVSKFDEDGVLGGGSSNFSVGEQQDEVQVQVENYGTGAINIWSAEKFQERLIMMRDALQTFEDSGALEHETEAEIFQEEPEPILLGQAFYMLEGLAYQMDNPRKVPIVATNNRIYGQVDVNVVPCDENGDEDLDEEQLVDDPKDLINQSLDFKVKITQISNLPEDFCRDIFCEYEFYMDK